VAGYIALAAIGSKAQSAMSLSLSLQNYCYAGDDLGAVYGHDVTTLKLWAPDADAVKVVLFDDQVLPI
jgi:hypothetical protein